MTAPKVQLIAGVAYAHYAGRLWHPLDVEREIEQAQSEDEREFWQGVKEMQEALKP